MYFLHFCMSLKQLHWQFWFWNTFSSVFVWQTALEDKDSVTLWGKGQICLLSRIIKIMSFSRAKVGQICQQPPLKVWCFLSSGHHSCDIKSSVTNTGDQLVLVCLRFFWLLQRVLNIRNRSILGMAVTWSLLRVAYTWDVPCHHHGIWETGNEYKLEDHAATVL